VNEVDLTLAMAYYEHVADLTSGRVPVPGVSLRWQRPSRNTPPGPHEQGVTHRPVDVDELFPAAVRSGYRI
jgi:hypothetical protein